MKTCPKCNAEKDNEDFAWKDQKLNKRFHHCRLCQSKISKRHYHQNKSEYRKRNIQTTRITHEYIFNLKAQTACADCGLKYHPVVMDFDHLPEYVKRDHISSLARNRTLAVVKAEIAKCEIVCANCHRMRTLHRAGNDPAASDVDNVSALPLELTVHT